MERPCVRVFVDAESPMTQLYTTDRSHWLMIFRKDSISGRTACLCTQTQHAERAWPATVLHAYARLEDRADRRRNRLLSAPEHGMKRHRAISRGNRYAVSAVDYQRILQAVAPCSDVNARFGAAVPPCEFCVGDAASAG